MEGAGAKGIMCWPRSLARVVEMDGLQARLKSYVVAMMLIRSLKMYCLPLLTSAMKRNLTKPIGDGIGTFCDLQL